MRRYEKMRNTHTIFLFYSLVKMVYGFALEAERGDRVSEIELEQSIRRNFSGLDDLDPVKIFSRKFPRLKPSVKVRDEIYYLCKFKHVYKCEKLNVL